MASTIIVEGPDIITEQLRVEWLTEINKLSDIELERLASLASSPKAKTYLNGKWNFLKKFVI